MATAKLKSIKELYGEKFFIPSYQRGYRWTTVQMQELLEDLYDFASRVLDGSKEYYCLQPIIVREKEEERGVWEVVDGQQRLTALWLISALYYCNNREELQSLGKSRETYTLEYQEKPVFMELFNKIDKYVESDDGTVPKIGKVFEKEKGGSVDTLNLVHSMQFIAGFQYKEKMPRTILDKIVERMQNIVVIWYVLDQEENAIQTFTNINANKIELTNSELIKAILLNCIKENEVQNTALQWENIEKGLKNESFWNFIANKTDNKKKKQRDYSTRIDYLFEIWCAKENVYLSKIENDRYSIFHAISKRLAESDKIEKKAEQIWKDIQGIYEILNDWYEDYFWYHAIGTLLTVNTDNDNQQEDTELLKDLFKAYSESDKQTFKKELKSRLIEVYFDDKNKKSMDVDFEEIKNDVVEITYEDKRVRNILLLYNMSMLINANNTYERFPFDLYKKNVWELEHINPQNPKDATLEEKEKWLCSYQKLLMESSVDHLKTEREKLFERIDACKSKNFDTFDDVATEIINYFGIQDNDSIGNLVLLDENTNHGYKNDCFSEKRKKIIEIERKKNVMEEKKKDKKNDKYIPIGTKWVFLKGFDKAEQLIVWGINDMQEYMDDIAQNIYKLLGGKIDE